MKSRPAWTQRRTERRYQKVSQSPSSEADLAALSLGTAAISTFLGRASGVVATVLSIGLITDLAMGLTTCLTDVPDTIAKLPSSSARKKATASLRRRACSSNEPAAAAA